MVDVPDEVDRLTEQMRHAGARVTKEPVDAEFFTGRSAYLCDPEGNYFEIAWTRRAGQPSPGSNTPRRRGLSRPLSIPGRNALGLSRSGHSQRGSSIALHHSPIRHLDVLGTYPGGAKGGRLPAAWLPVEAPSDTPQGGQFGHRASFGGAQGYGGRFELPGVISV
jgi:hypothetical protein